MKKFNVIMVFLLCVTMLLMFIFVGCHNYGLKTDSDNQSVPPAVDGISQPVEESQQKIGIQGELVVNRTKITDQKIFIFNHEKFANLPVISVMKALGAEVVWMKDNIANITYNGKTYQLDTTKNYLREGETVRNYIAVPPGTSHGVCYQVINGDYFVDSDSMGAFFKAINVEVIIDYDNLVVYIESAMN